MRNTQFISTSYVSDKVWWQVVFRLSLYLRTLNFLRKYQLLYYIRFLLLYRLYKVLGDCLGSLVKGLIPSSIGIRGVSFVLLKKILLLENENEEEICRLKEAITKRRFIFLNVERIYKDKVIWNDKEMSKLWRYGLHYFDYAICFAMGYFYKSDEKYYLDFKNLVQEWIRGNPFGRGDGWEPYPTSVRIVNWIKTYILFEELMKKDLAFESLFLKEIYFETLFLEKNLEFHLYGNHLLKNIKALIYSGVFFESNHSDKWLEKGLRLLQKELKEQILPDGGHFERSPMYHKVVLQDLLEIYAILKDHRRDQDLSWLEKKIRCMFLFLQEILHPDGEISFFNDSTLAEGPQAGVLTQVYEFCFHQKSESTGDGNLTIKRFEESGYFVIRDDKGSKAIIDCGKIGPDYLPAHAHCDTLSYELSLSGKRFIVNTGVYEYAIGEKRHYCRSTRAHNTVMVDGLDQSEIWSSFRVAERASPIYVNLERLNGIGYFQGAHDGYRRIDVIHRRKAWFGVEKILVVLDELEGKGIHNLESFVHFHPTVKVTCEGGEISIEFESNKLSLVQIGKTKVDIIKTPYFPEFGREEDRFSVRLLAENTYLPYRFGYALVPGIKGEAYLEGERIIVEFDGGKRVVLQ